MDECYDYITLIGVFEYSKGYIGTDDPYVEMIRRIKRHLKPGGQILIAIENRLGLKYFAGCTEDHTGVFLTVSRIIRTYRGCGPFPKRVAGNH